MAAPYPKICLQLEEPERQQLISAGKPFAFRLNAAAALQRTGPLSWTDVNKGTQKVTPELLNDVVLARKDVMTSYHLSVVVDDAIQGVTLVTRAEDLFGSTHIHRLLQALLHLPTPEYHHHKILTGPDGRRLSKRDKSMTLHALRVTGRTAAEVRTMAGFD